MSYLDLDTLPLEVAEKVVTELQSEGRAFVRYTLVNGIPAIKVLTRDDLHCATCRCPALHGVAPAPGNPNSKSWHNNAGGLQDAGSDSNAGPSPEGVRRPDGSPGP